MKNGIKETASEQVERLKHENTLLNVKINLYKELVTREQTDEIDRRVKVLAVGNLSDILP